MSSFTVAFLSLLSLFYSLFFAVSIWAFFWPRFCSRVSVCCFLSSIRCSFVSFREVTVALRLLTSMLRNSPSTYAFSIFSLSSLVSLSLSWYSLNFSKSQSIFFWSSIAFFSSSFLTLMSFSIKSTYWSWRAMLVVSLSFSIAWLILWSWWVAEA